MRIGSLSDNTLPLPDTNLLSQNVGLDNSQRGPYLKNVPSISEQRLNELIEHGNKVLQRLDTSLQWSVHQESHQLIVKVVDTQTNEILREIPPEKYLDLVHNLCEQVGLFLDEKK